MAADGMTDFGRAADVLDRRHFERVAGDHVEPALEAAGATAQEHVRQAARRHRKTGKLERFVKVRSSGHGLEATVDVHASGRVAHLITGGTGPHDIAPVRSRAIAMTSPGGDLVGFAATVHHPGTRPDPFVARGIEASGRDVERIVHAAGDRIVGDLSKQMTSRRP